MQYVQSIETDPRHTPTSCDDYIFLLREVEALDALVDFEDGLVGLEACLGDAPLQCCLLAGALRHVLGALQLLQLLLHVCASGCASCPREQTKQNILGSEGSLGGSWGGGGGRQARCLSLTTTSDCTRSKRTWLQPRRFECCTSYECHHHSNFIHKIIYRHTTTSQNCRHKTKSNCRVVISWSLCWYRC